VFITLPVDWVSLIVGLQWTGILEWTVEWTMEKIFYNNIWLLLCSYLLTNLLTVSSALYWPTFMHPPSLVPDTLYETSNLLKVQGSKHAYI